MSLRSTLATAEGKKRYVRRLFATIADRYDLITVVLSWGLDQGWKDRIVRYVEADRACVLDVACGTGDITFRLATSGARVVGIDVTPRMIELARRRAARQRVMPAFLIGDMMGLPFRDESFDAVTVGYGIRSAPIPRVAIDEMFRVLKRHGRLVSLDFGRPENRIVRAVYLAYLTLVGSVVGWLLHRDPDTYRYIPESIRHYPGPFGVAELLRESGFREASVEPILGGLMAINTARK